MVIDGINWGSFWDLASPQEAARLLREQYGSDAARHGAESSLAANSDGRDEDYDFWLAVFADLRAAGPDGAGQKHTDKEQGLGALLHASPQAN